MARKEGNNLTVRDYTDDIYNGSLNQSHFLEGILQKKG